MNILRYDDSTVKSILWKLDAAIEQVERIDGENAIRASEDGLVNSGLSAKAGLQPRLFRIVGRLSSSV